MGQRSSQSPRRELCMKILRGRVVSGVGNFSYWIEKLHDHYERKTGVRLFPGTLNISLDQPFDLPAQRIRLEAEEYGGTVSVNIVACSILGHPAFILRTDKADSEIETRALIEVACELKLRDKYELSDGDIVEVEVAALS